MSILIVAAYVSARSLLQVLDNPACRRLSPDTTWRQTLHEMLSSVIVSLENYSGTNDEEDIQDLAKQIAEVANEAENIIDFHVVNLLRDEHHMKDKNKLNEGSERDEPEDKNKLNEGSERVEPEDKKKLNEGFGRDVKISCFCQVIGKINYMKEKLLNMVKHKAAGSISKPNSDEHVDKKTLNEGSGGDDDICIEPSSFCQEMDKVIEKIDSIQKQLLIMVQYKKAVEEKLPRISLPSTAGSISVPLPSSANNTIAVGLDDHVKQIMEKLTGNQNDLQIIPIVGMGGIGKTTLARNVFDNKLVVQHFDIRIWFTISQEYSVHETLVGIVLDVSVNLTRDELRTLGIVHDVNVDLSHDKLRSKTSAQLQEILHKILSGRRYLIVMDDLWSIKAWDDFKFFFSDNNDQKSRIMVTTRMLTVANSICSRDAYVMNLLEDDQSWNLLCEKVFGQQSCSTNLEQIGKRIAIGCRGLPLALVTIDGLLAKSDKTEKYWESVAKNVNSVVNSENEDHCLKVLHLSYNHLPIHLKPCFLYMRVYPEDYVVEVSDLIKFWIAEGFIKPIKDKEWEEVAREYLKDLIDRNLIFTRELSHIGKVKTCGIHDLLRDLCVREYDNKLFFGISKVQRVGIEKLEADNKNKCVLCGERIQQEEEMIQIFTIHPNSRTTSRVGVVACKGCSIMYSNLNSRLRVVKAARCSVELFQPTKLRNLSWRYFVSPFLYGGPPSRHESILIYSSLHLLWNLQTLNIDLPNQIVVPSEIWEMTQLRHIYLRKTGYILPNPVVIILENLQSLSTIVGSRCTEVLFKRIPNLIKLRIRFDMRDEDKDDYWSTYSLSNKVVDLHKLESLYLECRKISYLGEMAFPNSLKRLTLKYCRISWEKMSMIGSLPNLQLLKLYQYAFVGKEWNPVEGDFLQLKYLSIDYHRDWKQWGGQKRNTFPFLRPFNFGI